MLPSMTLSAPAAIALAKSPENLIPPSAMTGIPFFFMLETTSAIAVIWGTPTPVTILVVQIEPGPIPTFTASAPAFINADAPSAVATFPPMTSILG